MNRVLVLFKPDCYERGLVGECLARFERRGFRIVGIHAYRPTRQQIYEHYVEHQAHPVFESLVAMTAAQPLVAAVLQHDSAPAVETARALLGPFREPIPGTIRGDFATSLMRNVMHVSSDAAAADREIALWFDPAELLLG